MKKKMTVRFDVIIATFVFWLVFAAFVVFADTGLYMAAWHRSLLADSQRQTMFNRKFVSLVPYTALEELTALENDGLGSMNRYDSSVATLDRQVPHNYGRAHLHMEANYKGCEDLRKLVRLANTNSQVGGLTVQQTLADQTLNFAKCIVEGRLTRNFGG